MSDQPGSIADDSVAWLRLRCAQHIARFGRFALEDLPLHVMLQLFAGMIARALRVENIVVWGVDIRTHSLRVLAEAGRLRQERIGQKIQVGAEALSNWVADLPGSQRVAAFFAQCGLDEAPNDGRTLTKVQAIPLVIEGQLSGVVLIRQSRQARWQGADLAFIASMTHSLALVARRCMVSAAADWASQTQGTRSANRCVAHQFNNVMTVVLGNLQLLAEEPGDSVPAHLQLAIDDALFATRRGVMLAGQFSSPAATGNEAVTAVDAGRVVRCVASVLRHAGRHRTALTVESSNIHCVAMPIDLRLVLLDVALDAADSLLDGEHLALACRRMAAQSISGRDDGDDAACPRVVITVSVVAPRAQTGPSRRPRKRAFLTEADMRRSGGRSLASVHAFAGRSGGHASTTVDSRGGRTLTLILLEAPPAHLPALELMEAL